jgi:hypothetical protein
MGRRGRIFSRRYLVFLQGGMLVRLPHASVNHSDSADEDLRAGDKQILFHADSSRSIDLVSFQERI